MLAPYSPTHAITCDLCSSKTPGLSPQGFQREEDQARYGTLIQHAKGGVIQFDRFMTILMAKNPAWQVKEHTQRAFSSVSFANLVMDPGLDMYSNFLLACLVPQSALLKYAVDQWEKHKVAMLQHQHLFESLTRLKTEIGSLTQELRAFASSNGGTSSPAAGNATPPVAQPPPAEAASKKVDESVLAPRLRVEDLKPPPAKRQKQSTASPKSPSVPAAPEKPKTQTKRPQPKQRKKKEAPANVSVPPPSEPIDVDAIPTPAVEITASPANITVAGSPKDVKSKSAADASGAAEQAPPDNRLGLNVAAAQMMQAKLEEEKEAKADPVKFLNDSWKRLEAVLAGRERDAVERVFADLQTETDIVFEDGLSSLVARTGMSTEAVSNINPSILPAAVVNEPPESFDYSSFIDLSALDVCAEQGDQATIDATPDLLSSSDPRFEVSPSSEGLAGTPRVTPRVQTAPIKPMSPPPPRTKSIDVFGEDGWLGDGLMDFQLTNGPDTGKGQT